MKIVGCDLHARQQSIALLDTETGELLERRLEHEADQVREFYASLTGPVVVGIEATGAMQWFLQLLEELEIECRVGHPAKIRAAETRKQKHDRRDALLALRLLLEKRFPTIWMPSTEQRDLRALLRDRHQWVKMRTRVQSTLQAIALESRAAERQGAVESSRSGVLGSFAAASLYRTTTKRTTAPLRATAEANPGTQSAGRTDSGATSASTTAVNPSGRRSGYGAGD